MGTQPIDAARWFIAAAKDSGTSVTNFQIQKLLYYAHGQYLNEHGKPLFNAGFQAWDHGPVCPPAYRAFSTFGSGPILNVKVDRERLAAKIAAADLAALEDVWASYGDWSVSELWEDVHRPGSPWERVYVPGQDNTAISDQSIRGYFAELQAPRLRRSMNRLRKRRTDRGEARRQPVGDAGIVQEIEDWSDLRAASTTGLLG